MTFKITNDSIKLIDYISQNMEFCEIPSLKELYIFLNDVKLKDIKILFYDDENINNVDVSSDFISEEINNYIKEKLNKKMTCVIMIDDYLSVTINVYYESEGDTQIKQLLYMIIKYLRYISSISTIEISTLEINYYLVDIKKIINEEPILTNNQVNSGSTLVGSSSFINIWRKEEILKVTLHELIHAFGFSRYKDSEKLIKYYNEKYNVNSKIINSDEAYTEVWANILNCFLISQLYNEKSYTKFLTMISLEINYSIYLAQKILDKIKGLNKLDINKETNVLAYYLIRAEIYENFDKFIKISKNENKDYINISKNSSIFNFLMKNNKITENNSLFNNSHKNTIIYKTMRMSLMEIYI